MQINIRIVFIGDDNNKRIKILNKIENTTINIISNIFNEKDFNNKIPKDVIDLFIIDKITTLNKKISTFIKNNRHLNHIPIISLISRDNITDDFSDDSDLIVSDNVSDIEFKYYVKTMIKMKIMDDELKKEKIILELKVKDRTIELENKAERLNITLNSIGDGVIVTNAKGEITTLNPVAAELTDVEEQNYINKHIDDVFQFYIDSDKINIFDIVKTSKKQYKLPIDSILITKSKKIRIADSASPMFDKHHNFTGMVVVFHDVTEDCEMRRILTESEKKYKKLYDSVPDFIYTLDLFGNIITMNDNIIKLGYNVEETIGKNISFFLDENGLELSLSMINIKKQDPLKITKYNVKVKTKSNEYRVLEVKTHLIKNIDNNEYEIFAIARDVTEIVEFQEKLKEAKDRAERSDKLKTYFISNLSHEIKTPMNSIIGFSDLLNNENNTVKIKKYTDIIIQAGYQLLSIIDDIMDVSELESGTLMLIKKEFSLNNLFIEIYNEFKDELYIRNKYNIKFILKIDENDTLIYNDEKRLKQIIKNIIKNSIKFTETGHITYGYTITDDGINIFVHDTGIGIKEEHINFIFDSFFQINRNKLKKQEGTGLGLTICRDIIYLLGGEINVESEFENGTSIYVNIPIITVNNKHTEINETVNDNIKNKNVCIIVEDINTYGLLQLLLLSLSMNIHRINNIFDIEKERKNEVKYDILIIDINNLSFDVNTILSYLETNNINIPILFLSNDKNDLKNVKWISDIPINATQLINTLKEIFKN